MADGSMVLVDAAGRRRSPATLPGFLAGRAPRNKGMQYPPDPPRPEEIILVMRQAGNDRHGLRIRALIAVLWRAGLRISEALALNETDIDERRGSLLIRHGKGDKRREVPIRRDLAQLLQLHIATRRAGPLFASRQQGSGPTPYVLTRQRVGQMVRDVAGAAGITKRVYPHLLRHTVATRLLALGMDITDLQRFLGHESITTTRLYAETTAATLQRSFDRITDPAAHALIAGIRQQRGDDAALIAADLLARRRAERVSTAGA